MFYSIAIDSFSGCYIQTIIRIRPWLSVILGSMHVIYVYTINIRMIAKNKFHFYPTAAATAAYIHKDIKIDYASILIRHVRKKNVDKKCFSSNIETYCVCVSFNVYPLLMYWGRRIYFRACVYIYILCEVYISFFSVLFSFFFVFSFAYMLLLAYTYIFYISYMCIRVLRDKNDRQVYLRI